MIAYDAGEQSSEIDALLNRKSGRLHLVGIGGVGMAGLALLLKREGFTVTGCDLSPGRNGEWLEANGISVDAGHDPEHLSAGVDWMIMTPAVSLSEPEIHRAEEWSIPLFARGAVLARLLRKFTGLAVAGTHGKTTVSTFTTQLLKSSGRDPSWCIGGEATALGGVAGAGAGDVLVVEADESDGTLMLYAPDIAVVTNIEYDHMEHFDGKEAFENCFRQFARQAGRRIIYCHDDPGAQMVCRGLPGASSYGLSAGSRMTAVDLMEEASGSDFDLLLDGVSLGRIRLPVPGRHNVLNALAAAAAAHEIGLDAGELRAGLQQVSLPRRRFEQVVDRGGIRVISDYAHHPTEIAVLMKTALGLGAERVRVVFQPHRYTRTRALGQDFPGAFRGVDEVILLPVYAASESPLPGGTTWDLYGHFRAQDQQPMVASSLPAAWDYLRRRLSPGDLLLVVGAGDVVRIADWALESIGRGLDSVADMDLEKLRRALTSTELRLDEPLAGKTSLGVGGMADLWAGVGSVQDLSLLLEWSAGSDLPVTVLGNGTNVVISDLGIRGVTVRLKGEFKSVREEEGTVIAGAAVGSPQLLEYLAHRGLSGLEFLDGIPGTVGGMLRMNAGAWGHEILEHVLWIRCLNRDGALCILRSDELEYRYRSCESIAGRIVVDAGFRLAPGNAKEIEKRRDEYRAKRQWMRGIRCAGSVFRNPEGEYAGRLIEAAGLKNARIGGAAVSCRHANVIVTGPGASASDVLALIEQIRAGVKERSGVDLMGEVVLL